MHLVMILVSVFSKYAPDNAAALLSSFVSVDCCVAILFVFSLLLISVNVPSDCCVTL